MSNSEEGAFPSDSRDSKKFSGLTKREYFAGLAMQGMLSSIEVIDFDAELAVTFADDLLAELSKPPEGSGE